MINFNVNADPASGGLGLAMLAAPTYGRGFGVLTLMLGLIGVVVAVAVLITPGSPAGVVGIFALLVFHVVLGWKTSRLAGSAHESVVHDRERSGA